MIKVKICGITNLEDALTAIDAGADALGFVFHPQSPRHVFPEQAAAIIRHLPSFVQTVGLFVNDPLEQVNATVDLCGLDLVQLHGEEKPGYCDSVRRRVIKSFRVKDITSLESMRDYRVAAFLLDAWSPAAHGGTGQTFNWEIAACVAQSNRIILAGGLTPLNVVEAARQVRPYAVDVSSGVESGPGKKDADKIREFIRLAKEAVP
ncbi:phosphoribosylanthranilate isomerase [Oryzomonas japonica]|uniref:N-(5'-phosphoribosyl)anthranilate isomerase n=1 Tax=Oryzomonas japonica TaxID=2603858 RepID=A0A7J4ZRH2_9BACT|nr:phosphoribosylanthranilate isomerase [Oryzomonas japonica]KAB0665724.1 phosphoribosylanthranilate isomerase [Oryzomonas japonica]